MPRQLRPLDPGTGPVQAFSAQLRELWEGAGRPTFLQMARKTGKSRTAMAEAVGGDHLPSWETVAAFVTVCGGNPNEWRPRWELARDARTSANQQSHESTEVGEQLVAELPHSRRRLLPFVATVVVTAVVASAATAIGVSLRLSSSPNLAATPQRPRAVVITVQNKVALGANGLIEDTSPAYLSSRPIPYCSHHGCEVPGTQLKSGALIVAVCYTRGAQMFNFNLDSSASQNNPYRVSSRLWYKAVFPDKRSGYISEVYVVASNRGGMGLPRCQ